MGKFKILMWNMKIYDINCHLYKKTPKYYNILFF